MAVDVEPCAKLLCCYVAGACLKRVEGAKLVGLSVDSQRAVVCAFLGWWVHLTSSGSEVEEKLGRWTDSPEQGPEACHAGRKAPYSWWHSSVWVIDLSCCFHFFTGWQIHSLNRMCVCVCVCARARTCLVVQLCPTLCDPLDCSLPDSFVHGILQARTLEWVAIPFSQDLPDPWI